MKKYKIIVIGAGAAGLFFAGSCSFKEDCFVLEKTHKAGTKLLMSGAGQCNITHGGSIKEFSSCYGDNGKRIRGCLYKHNNTELRRFLTGLGIDTIEREDGKIFPSSLSSRQVLDGLLAAAAKNGTKIKYGCLVSGIHPAESGFLIETSLGAFQCENLVIATGGCSYPSTGSDGSMFEIIKESLGISVSALSPALVPIFVQDYPFAELSGISFKNVKIKIFYPGSSSKTDGKSKEIKPRNACGDLLLTHKNFSGPIILNNSRYISTGSRVEINFIFPYTVDTIFSLLKETAAGNNKSIEAFFAEKIGLPKRFCEVMTEGCSLRGRRLSSLSGKEMNKICLAFCQSSYSVSGLGGFREAMATSGGISLDDVDLSSMESKAYSGLYFIGEVVDIDGDTGGYNLQFAYSSALSALKHIESKYPKI